MTLRFYLLLKLFSVTGGPNLQIRTNISVAAIKWKESLLDPESAEFISKTYTLLNEVNEVYQVVFRMHSGP